MTCRRAWTARASPSPESASPPWLLSSPRLPLVQLQLRILLVKLLAVVGGPHQLQTREWEAWRLRWERPLAGTWGSAAQRARSGMRGRQEAGLSAAPHLPERCKVVWGNVHCLQLHHLALLLLLASGRCRCCRRWRHGLLLPPVFEGRSKRPSCWCCKDGFE